MGLRERGVGGREVDRITQILFWSIGKIDADVI